MCVSEVFFVRSRRESSYSRYDVEVFLVGYLLFEQETERVLDVNEIAKI